MNSNFEELLENAKENLGVEHKYKIIPSLLGADTLVLENDKNAYFHSKYDPLMVAENFAKILEDVAKKTYVFIYIGLGLGYEVLELFKHTTEEKFLIVYEDNYELIERFINTYNFKEINKNGNITIAYSKKMFENALVNCINHGNVMLVKEYVSYSYRKYFPNEFENIEASLENYINSVGISNNTLLANEKKWFYNSMENTYNLFDSKSIDKARGAFKGVPGIIVSAGPSLKRNIEALRMAKGKFLIICVNTAYKALLANNIIPDFVFAIDGDDNIALPYIETKINAPILYVMQTSSAIVDLATEEKVIVHTTNNTNIQSILLEKNNIEYTLNKIETGASVANASLSLMDKLGCDPIVFIGQDLAFSEEYTHAENSGKANTKVSDLDIDVLREVKGMNGEILKTRVEYKDFLNWFVNKIEFLKTNGSKTTYINSSIGGAHIEGTEVVPLNEVIEKYAYDRDVTKICKEFLESGDVFAGEEKKNAYYSLKDYYNEYKDLSTLAEEAIEYSNKLIKAYSPKNYDTKKINYLVNKLDDVDKKLKSYDYLLDISRILFSAISVKFSTIEISDLSKDQKILDKNKKYYLNLMELADISYKEFERILKKLNSKYYFEEA